MRYFTIVIFLFVNKIEYAYLGEENKLNSQLHSGQDIDFFIVGTVEEEDKFVIETSVSCV